MRVLACAAGALAGIGILQCLAGWVQVRRFGNGRSAEPPFRPPLSVLKPLYGPEPMLEEALATFFRQHYPLYQLVFGVQNAADAALDAVRRLQARFPECDVAVVVDPTLHGPNRKVGNLINMLGAARHDVLVIADSDLHVRPDYLDRLAAAFDEPGTGLVTTLYAGLPATNRAAARLGATQVTHGFLPGALLARALGRQDCLGATMMLSRPMLARIGGFEALVAHLADDNVLGRLVRDAGAGVRLADTVPLTTVPETSLAALWAHELRWARTIRALVPAGFAISCVQYPIFWAALAAMASGFAAWAGGLFAAAWMVRGAAARGIDRALRPRLGGLAFPPPLWLLPLRDLMSVAVMIASYGGRRVAWRGYTLDADDGVSPARDAYPDPKEGLLKS